MGVTAITERRSSNAGSSGRSREKIVGKAVALRGRKPLEICIFLIRKFEFLPLNP
jgi:hypothetical protein